MNLCFKLQMEKKKEKYAQADYLKGKDTQAGYLTFAYTTISAAKFINIQPLERSYAKTTSPIKHCAEAWKSKNTN